MAYTVAFISLGCAKNLVNSEQMIHLLCENGYEIVSDPDGADAVVINTCGFIDAAKSEAIDTILEMGELKKQNRLSKIIVAGCLTERYQDEMLEELPEVDALVGVGSFGEIVSALEQVQQGDKPKLFGDINAPLDETGRMVSTGPGWAYLKIADGCDNHCAFCIIPKLRGKYRSRPLENIVEEAKALAETGVKELILIAQDITRYGTDLYGTAKLADLLQELVTIPDVSWIRLHYLYPEAMDDHLISVIAQEDKIVKYLDIPIQHIHNGLLKKMNRRGTGDEIRALFSKLRERIPGLVLRTSLIAGHPGEGEEEFLELCAYLREAKIERAGVFPYSKEEGTPAARMRDIPDEETASRRAELIQEIQIDIFDAFNSSRIGNTLQVLCDGYDPEYGLFYGRSYAESPDIDGRILFSGEAVPGEFYPVHITEMTEEGDLKGQVTQQ